MISSIKAMKILKHVGGPKGTWIKDSSLSSGKVYIFNGTDSDTVHEFPSVQDFARSQGGLFSAMELQLPSRWRGTGHVVHHGHVYYISRSAEEGEPSVIKYNVRNNTVVDSAVFPVPDQSPVYSLSTDTMLDLAVDEEGLWAVHASLHDQRHISLAKLDADTLDVEQTWDTRCARENAEAAFVICGTLYVVYNTQQPGRSRIQCVFDANGVVADEEAPLVYFPKRYGAHASLKYNPKEKLLYAWDDGYQILYRLAMKKKLEV